MLTEARADYDVEADDVKVRLKSFDPGRKDGGYGPDFALRVRDGVLLEMRLRTSEEGIPLPGKDLFARSCGYDEHLILAAERAARTAAGYTVTLTSRSDE